MHKCTYIHIYTYINTCIKLPSIARHFENNFQTHTHANTNTNIYICIYIYTYA